MPKLIIPLMGGLGNQLFQLQAALSLFDGEIELIGSLGRPRTTNGLPDICYCELPSRVAYKHKKSYKLLEKVHAYLLRSSLNRNYNRFKIGLVTAISAVLFSLYFMRPVRVITATDLGFCELDKIRKSTVLIGYFQSYRWHNHEMSQILSTDCSDRIQTLKNESSAKSICILHIRLTDYLSEKNFGQLSTEYYEEALDLVFSRTRIDEIWLFSDDLTLADTILPSKYRTKIRKIDDSHLLPIEILLGMTNGTAYVIANSTFSWWAARYSSARIVVAPKPWFQNNKSPNDLIPVDWLELTRQ
jgi:hypothetical protein